jgi:diguanylate cyclase (GGDEF)-like protein
MVADDSRVMRLAVKKILGTGFDLVQAENGTQAWEQLGQDPTIQALVTDIEMPGLDGYELICHIRAADDARLRELPVIAITGAEDETTKQRAFACGATDFITKPLDAIQLLARVQAYVRYDQTTRELTEQSIADVLTGLPSRRYLLQRGEQDLAYARRQGSDMALIRIDIDNFKQHYRALGDDGSDRLLGWVAEMLIQNARTEDTVARISGAEFALHANGIGMAEAVVICERVQSALARKPFVNGGNTVPVTLSIGMASLKQDNADSVEAMMRLANQRVVQARIEGGNRMCGSIPNQSAPVVEEVTLGAPEAEPVMELQALETPTIDPAAEYAVELEVPGALSDPLPTVDTPDTTGANVGDIGQLEIPVETPLPSAAELISVDRALTLLGKGREQLLLPYLEHLMVRLQPLLDLYHRHRK